MRICLIGKFPPIQGGVSTRTYWTAHRLAARGHDVHVVTNAKEARSPFRMHMRVEDWARCEANYDAGRVTVHWTDPVDPSQAYLPMASPFVSKLSALAAKAHSERPFDVIFSHYMEPYGIAGHLVAQITGVPHVVRMAGSDAGRLWHHPQLEPLYDHVLRQAAVVIGSGTVAERALSRGVDPTRIAAGGGFTLPEELFTPIGPALDLSALREEVDHDPYVNDQFWGAFSAERPYFGVCGKLGDRKGSFALLAAMARLKHAGLDVGLVALAHGQPAVEERFRAEVLDLRLDDRVLQIPFLPHWRVPEFLRGCLAVCCLEQDFPISIHSPIIPFEVLLCGKCLVGSTEVIRKLPEYSRLPNGYGCVAMENVNDIGKLTERLAAIVADPFLAPVVGARGYAFALELQKETAFPGNLEQILADAASGQRKPLVSQEDSDDTGDHNDGFLLTRLASVMFAASGDKRPNPPFNRSRADLIHARAVLKKVEREIFSGRPGLDSIAAAVRIEIALAEAEIEYDPAVDDDNSDPLFRLQIRRWAMQDSELAGLVPIRDRRLRVLEFDFDVREFQGVQTIDDLPIVPTRGRSYLAVFAGSGGREPVLIDPLTAHILELCDGTRSVAGVLKILNEKGTPEGIDFDHFEWIERLFVCGLIELQQCAGAGRKVSSKKADVASR
jgi:glycosyltransferase involved in cell wall biosynthesis